MAHRFHHERARAMPDAILNARQVKELTGLSCTTIWRLERSGYRVQLSLSRVGWSREEVGVWLETQKAAATRSPMSSTSCPSTCKAARSGHCTRSCMRRGAHRPSRASRPSWRNSRPNTRRQSIVSSRTAKPCSPSSTARPSTGSICGRATDRVELRDRAAPSAPDQRRGQLGQGTDDGTDHASPIHNP
jgi:predicted DNA-binding transcriptional regulator AlpA